MKKFWFLFLSLQLWALSAAIQCPVGTSTFGGTACVSLLDHCLSQGRLVEEESCGRKCSGNSAPDVNGEHCRDDSERLRPVLMMEELKELLETQLITLRKTLDTSELDRVIRDIAQIPSIAALKEEDYQILTEALANLYDVQDSDLLLDIYFKYLTDRLNTRLARIEDALHEIQDGNNKINTVLRNIKSLYNEFVYKIKDLNDEIARKRDSVTEALTRMAVFEAMLNGVKQDVKTLDKSKLVSDLFSVIQTNFLEISQRETKVSDSAGISASASTENVVLKTLKSLPSLISIGSSLFTPSDPNEGREMEAKLRRSLKAVGTISSQLSSKNWELVQSSGSFLSMRNLAEKLKDEGFGPSGATLSEDLISEALNRCRDLMELSEILSSQ